MSLVRVFLDATAQQHLQIFSPADGGAAGVHGFDQGWNITEPIRGQGVMLRIKKLSSITRAS